MDQGRRQPWPSWKKCERRQYQSLQSFKKSNDMIYQKWVSVNLRQGISFMCENMWSGLGRKNNQMTWLEKFRRDKCKQRSRWPLSSCQWIRQFLRNQLKVQKCSVCPCWFGYKLCTTKTFSSPCCIQSHFDPLSDPDVLQYLSDLNIWLIGQATSYYL